MVESVGKHAPMSSFDTHSRLLLTELYEYATISYMKEERYQVLRIWKTTHRILRQIAAQTDESLVELLDRLARQEQQRIQ